MAQTWLTPSVLPALLQILTFDTINKSVKLKAQIKVLESYKRILKMLSND